MPVPRLVVVGASAGGVEALSRLLSLLPADLPAAVLVVLHTSPAAPCVLPRILARAGALPVHEARHGMLIEAGRVYVAPGDQHMIVDGGVLALVGGPRENGHRPALDPLFRSAAREQGPRVAGVVLSGNLSDGTHGLAQVAAHGGVTLVQDPAEALFEGMPRSAMGEVRVDAVLPLAGLAAAIERFARAAAAVPPTAPELVVPEVLRRRGIADDARTADAVVVLAAATDEVELDGVGRIDVGPDVKDTALEAALWTAVMALEENASLARQVADRAGRHGRHVAEARFTSRAVLLDERARTVRAVLDAMPASTAPLEQEVHQ